MNSARGNRSQPVTETPEFGGFFEGHRRKHGKYILKTDKIEVTRVAQGKGGLMEVYLDETRVDHVFDPGESLERGLRAVHGRYGSGDRIIVGVKCDGVHLLNEGLHEALQKPVGAFRCIEIVTAAPCVLASEALGEARRSLGDVDARRVQIAAHFSAGRIREGMSGLGEMLSVWQQVHDVVAKSVQMISDDLASMRVEGESIEDVLDAPRRQLMQIRDALQTQDFVMLADLLEYEFGEAVQSWSRVIDALDQRAQERIREDAGGEESL